MTFALRAFASAIIGLTLMVMGAFSASADETQVAAAPVHKLTLGAVLNGDAKAAKTATFTVQPISSDMKDPPKVVNGPGEIEVPAGRYKVVTTLESMTLTDQINVAAPVTYTATFQAGRATFALITKIGGKPVSDAINWRILTWKKNSKGERGVITQMVGAQQQVLLPEGWYLLEANRNGKITKHTIQITAGLNYSYTLLEQ